ncbi:uncharacterized protein LOC114354057 isoform X1 [Ostrinia furnacalis]|uniref:uncharacterized protein LOC114354057 isoform X1 n=1 Tax=Ostrinia furnacalis TaxID=93504 RepID=UPI001038BC98|nr:uncharacterized protein LOC114354057 isoform X1 [Ostrinia furnacalis]
MKCVFLLLVSVTIALAQLRPIPPLPDVRQLPPQPQVRPILPVLPARQLPPNPKKGGLCGCYPIDNTLCASNYKTYLNECSMRCDHDYDGLYVLYYGPCVPKGRTQDTVYYPRPGGFKESYGYSTGK